MNFAFRRPLAVLLSFLAVSLSLPTAHAGDEAILLLDQASGVAGVQRNGKRIVLQPGDALQEQDLIVTDRSGRMTLRLGRHGFVEVGPNAEIGVERLPFAAFARDLKSIFSVSKGYFRVVWKHPQLSSNWPLFVYMAGHRFSLVSGEYFFQNLGGEQRACVAAGQIALQASGVEGIETIKPPACVKLDGKQAPQIAARNPDDWIAVRRGYSVESTAATLLARADAPAEPAPPPPAPKPVISTTASAQPVLAAPVAIAPPEVSAAEPALEAGARGLGPVAAAPVLPTPPPAPRATLTPALPSAPLPGPPTVATRPPLASPPLVIGEVRANPLPPPAAPKPAATTVVAKPAPAVPTATGGAWSLNVASYSEAAVAEREATRLRGSGYNAVARPAVINGKTWHRVQLTGFPDEAAARSAATELKSRMGLANVWVLKP